MMGAPSGQSGTGIAGGAAQGAGGAAQGVGGGTQGAGGGAQGAPGGAAAGAAPSAAAASQQAGGFKVSGPEGDQTLVEVGGLTMTKPIAWVWTAPTMNFRALQYAVPAQGVNAPAAELVFSVFPGGDGGPVTMNLDRWAGQFRGEDGAAAPSKRSESEGNGLKVSRIESTGAYMGMGQAAPRPGYMQLGAIVQAPGRNVFIKLVGPKETVESNRAAFDAMLTSMRAAEK